MIFEKLFPSLSEAVTHYSADRHTLKMHTTAHIELVFKYKDNKKWMLKTKDWPDF